MPNIGSFPVVTQDWESTLAAAKENEALLPDLTNERAALEQALAKAKALKEGQGSLRAARQSTTQELQQTLVDGRQLAEKLRDAAKFKLGRRSERLVQFSVTPQRKRGPRKTSTAVTPPPPVAPGPVKPNPA